MRQRTTEQIKSMVEKMRALVKERAVLAERSRMARVEGADERMARIERTDEHIRVIDRKLGWYRGRVPPDMHPQAVVELWEAKEAAAQAEA